MCPWLTGLRTDAAAQPCTLGSVLSMSDWGHFTHGTIPLWTRTLCTCCFTVLCWNPNSPELPGFVPVVFHPLGHKCITTVLHTGLLPLMHPLPGLSKCSRYKPSDKQHIQRYQQRVMKGMSRPSAAESQDKNHPGVYSRVGNTTLK